MDSDATRRSELHLAVCRYLPEPCAVLELEFRSGAVYRYFGIPPHTFEELLRAQSKGGYFNSHIRNRFAYAKVHAAGANGKLAIPMPSEKTEN